MYWIIVETLWTVQALHPYWPSNISGAYMMLCEVKLSCPYPCNIRMTWEILQNLLGISVVQIPLDN